MTKEETVIGLVADLVCGKTEEITRDSNLIELGLDSLDMVEIACNLEIDFDLNIPMEDEDDWKTVGDVVDYLEEHL